MGVYIPILRTAQAELGALKELSSSAMDKVMPYLFYRDTSQRTSLDKFCEVLLRYERFFLEFPDHPNNSHFRTPEEQRLKFQDLIENSFPVIPVISNSEKVKRRDLIQHGLSLYNLANALGIRIRVDNSHDLYIAAAIYDTVPDPQRLTIFVDFNRVYSKEEILKKFSYYPQFFDEAMITFTGTVWGENQSEFKKGEITKVDNYLFLAWRELNRNLKMPYSDSLTDNLNSIIPSSDETFYLKLIPYFKWLSLDGTDFLVIRAEEDDPALAKEIARDLINSYPHYFHESGVCAGCNDIRRVADPGSESKSNPTTRKKMSFVHHMEVIASLLP